MDLRKFSDGWTSSGLPHMNMRMLVPAGAVHMRLPLYLDRYRHQTSKADATLGNDMLCQMLHAVRLAAQHGDLQQVSWSRWT